MFIGETLMTDKDLDMITTAEAARILDYHPNHVRRLIREGTLPASKFSNVWMIQRDDVYKLKAQQTEGGRLPR
jgi:excisionase family DNA binding protein